MPRQVVLNVLVVLLFAQATALANDDAVRAFAERQALVTSLRRDKRVVAAAWSADLCAARQTRVIALREIRTQQHYAKIGGGVVDARQLHELQQMMRNADERIASARTASREQHFTFRPCADTLVAELMKCLNQDGDATCDDPRIQVIFEQPGQPDAVEPTLPSTKRMLEEILRHEQPDGGSFSVVR